MVVQIVAAMLLAQLQLFCHHGNVLYFVPMFCSVSVKPCLGICRVSQEESLLSSDEISSEVFLSVEPFFPRGLYMYPASQQPGKKVAGQVTVLKFCTLLLLSTISSRYSSSFVVIDSCVGTFSFFHLGEILAKLDFGLLGLVGMVNWILTVPAGLPAWQQSL